MRQAKLWTLGLGACRVNVWRLRFVPSLDLSNQLKYTDTHLDRIGLKRSTREFHTTAQMSLDRRRDPQALIRMQWASGLRVLNPFSPDVSRINRARLSCSGRRFSRRFHSALDAMGLWAAWANLATFTRKDAGPTAGDDLQLWPVWAVVSVPFTKYRNQHQSFEHVALFGIQTD